VSWLTLATSWQVEWRNAGWNRLQIGHEYRSYVVSSLCRGFCCTPRSWSKSRSQHGRWLATLKVTMGSATPYISNLRNGTDWQRRSGNVELWKMPSNQTKGIPYEVVSVDYSASFPILTKNALVVLISANIVAWNDFLQKTDHSVMTLKKRKRISESWTSTLQNDSGEVRPGTRSWESAIPMVRLHHFRIQRNNPDREWSCHLQHRHQIWASHLPPLPNRAWIHSNDPAPRSRLPQVITTCRLRQRFVDRAQCTVLTTARQQHFEEHNHPASRSFSIQQPPTHPLRRTQRMMSGMIDFTQTFPCLPITDKFHQALCLRILY